MSCALSPYKDFIASLLLTPCCSCGGNVLGFMYNLPATKTRQFTLANEI